MYELVVFFHEYKWAFINLHVRSGMVVISLNASKTSFDIVVVEQKQCHFDETLGKDR